MISVRVYVDELSTPKDDTEVKQARSCSRACGRICDQVDGVLMRALLSRPNARIIQNGARTHGHPFGISYSYRGAIAQRTPNE